MEGNLLEDFIGNHWAYTYYIPFEVTLNKKKELIKTFMTKHKGRYTHENYGEDNSFVLYSESYTKAFSLYIETTDTNGIEHYFEQYQILELVYYKHRHL